MAPPPASLGDFDCGSAAAFARPAGRGSASLAPREASLFSLGSALPAPGPLAARLRLPASFFLVCPRSGFSSGRGDPPPSPSSVSGELRGPAGRAPASFFRRFRAAALRLRSRGLRGVALLLPAPRARLRSSAWGRLCRPKPPWLLAAPACELLPRVLSSEVVSVPLVAGAHSRLRLSLIVRHSFFCATVQPPPPAPRSSDPARELILKTIGFWPLCGDAPTESQIL